MIPTKIYVNLLAIVVIIVDTSAYLLTFAALAKSWSTQFPSVQDIVIFSALGSELHASTMNESLLQTIVLNIDLKIYAL